MAKKKVPAIPRDVTARFGNRIVRTGTAPAGSFLANPDNWRIHPVVQQDALDKTLVEIGFVQSVIVNRRTDPAWGSSQHVETLVDGHLRISLALARGEDTPVPVSYVDLSPAEEAVILATFDPIGGLATRDHEKLDGLLKAIPNELTGVTALLHAERKTSKTVTFESAVHYRVTVECENLSQCEALASRLRGEGYRCLVT